MRSFLLCLTIIIGGIGDLFFVASVVSEPRGPQDDDPDTPVIASLGAQINNPSLGLGIGLPGILQDAENNIEGKQEGPIISTDNRCRSPRAANLKRTPSDYCQDVSPLRSQQQENGRPIGTFNKDKPAEDNYILPAHSNLEWAPPIRDFFETDPCQGRPWQVCAPYIPGLDFRAWSSGRLAGFDLEGCDYCMYGHFRGFENKHTEKSNHCELTPYIWWWVLLIISIEQIIPSSQRVFHLHHK